MPKTIRPPELPPAIDDALICDAWIETPQPQHKFLRLGPGGEVVLINRAPPRPPPQLHSTEVVVPAPENVCDPSTTVVDFAKHRFVRVGDQLIPLGYDAVGQQRASAGAPFGKPRQ